MKRLSVFDERRVPRDIRRYVLWRVLSRVVPCALMILTAVLALMFFDDVFFGAADKPFRVQSQMLGYTVVVIVPLLITGVPFKLIDRSFEGKVEAVHVYTTVEDPRRALHMSNAQYQRLNVRLTVRTQDGYRLKRSVAKSKMVDKRILNWYHEGDEVLHLYGTRYTVVLPDDFRAPVRCVICGKKSGYGDVRCPECGYSLIRK